MRKVSAAILAILIALSAMSVMSAHFFTAKAQTTNWCIGAAYNYSGGLSDFNFYFYNNGFTTSNGNPMQIELTVATSAYIYQCGLWIYNSNNVVVADEIHSLVDGHLVAGPWTHSISGAYNNYNTIELTIAWSSNGYYILTFVVNQKSYDPQNIGTSISSFGPQMAPSVVIESADTNSNDWNGVWIRGTLYNGYQGTPLHTHLYAGTWGVDTIGYDCPCQSSGCYVGSDLQAPNYVAVSGYNIDNVNSQCCQPYQIFIGDPMCPIFQLNDAMLQTIYQTFGGSAWDVQLS